jgi:hypothetical protein
MTACRICTLAHRRRVLNIRPQVAARACNFDFLRTPDKPRTRIDLRRPGTGSAQHRSGVQEKLAKHNMVRPVMPAANFSGFPDHRSRVPRSRVREAR